MSMLIERARRWGEELNQEWLEKGIKKGRAEGREEGRLEGERELVRRLVARRFGREAANDIVPLLAGVSDSDRLTAIAAMVFTGKTAAELAEWARGNGAAE